MANVRVTLLRCVKTDKGWRFFPVAMNRGRVRHGWVVQAGKEVQYPTDSGYYCLRMWEGSKKPVIKNVGNDPAEALLARKREEALRAAGHQVAEFGGTVLAPAEPRTIREYAKKFIERKQLQGRGRDSLDAYKSITADFCRIGPEYPEQVTEDHVLKFCREIEKRGLSERTRSNKYVSLCTFLRFAGVDTKKVLPEDTRRTLSRYPEEDVEIYSEQDIARLFSVCDEGHRLLYRVMLLAGLRMQEAAHLEWADIEEKTIRVRRKAGKWEVKARKDRRVPLMPELAEELKQWHEKRPKTKLVFGTRTDKPNTSHMLEELKEIVRRNNLNCGHCEGCQKEPVVCEYWYLHRFRSSFCTNLLRGGVDLRTVQAIMGHANIESTMRYLKAVEAEDGLEKFSAALASWRKAGCGASSPQAPHTGS